MDGAGRDGPSHITYKDLPCLCPYTYQRSSEWGLGTVFYKNAYLCTKKKRGKRMANVKVKGSAKLFDSKVLELLTRTHPLVILGMYIPLCAWLMWYFHGHINPSALVLTGVFFAGLFSWTFFEYILHRYVFHFVNDTKWAQRFHYYAHGVHHEYPKDKQRLVMPPIPSIIIAGMFFLLFWLIMDSYGFVFFSGFMIGYLCYAMIHYSMHAFRPPHNFTKFLWEYHNIHHFRYPNKAFGVSSPLWDHIFGTVPPKIEKKQAVTGK